mgnify:CR=1 FL=1
MTDAIRPTKKQQELLSFIESFIAEHGYSPSYREIMVGCNYTSIATVALHIKNLIARGHLKKRDKSARSLELTGAKVTSGSAGSVTISESQAKWLVQLIQARFSVVEQEAQITQKQIDELYVLIGSLKVIGLDDAAMSFMPRLNDVRERMD